MLNFSFGVDMSPEMDPDPNKHGSGKFFQTFQAK